MLPRLQAEEMLAGAHVAALGSGTMKAHDAKAAFASLRRMTGARRQAAAPAAGLAAMGFGVQQVTKRAG